MRRSRSPAKKLENKEEENKELENEVNKLTKDKSTLEKENKKLKHVLEATEAHVDDLTSKHSALDMEHKNLKKLHEKSKDSIERMHEFEKENKDLQQQLLVNKKTLATLREVSKKNGGRAFFFLFIYLFFVNFLHNPSCYLFLK